MLRSVENPATGLRGFSMVQLLKQAGPSDKLLIRKKQMNEAGLLLKAYYEALHELLASNKASLITKAEKLLRKEIKNRAFATFDREKHTAYRDAAVAFVDERIETYNPIGIQYTFDRTPSRWASEFELQLNWYDSQAEFQDLNEAADEKAEPEMTDRRLRQLANELITEMGAFPDKSIISAYQAEPALGKLPDYIVARAIEEIISS